MWILTCPLSSHIVRRPQSLQVPHPAQKELPVLSLAQRGLLSPSPAQRGLQFPCPAQRETAVPLSVALPLLGVAVWCMCAAHTSPESPEAHKYPPEPASSTPVIWQPLCSPSAHHLYGASSAGLPSSIVTLAGESLVSASASSL